MRRIYFKKSKWQNKPLLAGLILGCSETIADVPLERPHKLHRMMGFFYSVDYMERIESLQRARRWLADQNLLFGD